MAIKALKQEPKTGHWEVVSDGYGDNAYICECSECKDTVWVYKDADRKWNYCPNCGAKMTAETAIRKFNEFYDKALKSDYVEKPISWALYQTWKWFDKNEKSRRAESEESNGTL